jgi:cyclic pyranopterin phosphate synthase
VALTQPSLLDNHGRPVNYLRLAVTDRCNLRCFYCMPEEGIQYLPKKALLTYEEMERTVRVLAGLGVNKVRITGGEPFVRNGLLGFLRRLGEIPGVEALHLTTNGVLTAPHVAELKALGVRSVNLSLDTLDRDRFRHITRRDELPRVLDTLYALLGVGIEVKINMVVMEGKNTQDIGPMAELTRQHPVSVRFIEEMPFNGEGARLEGFTWNYRRILDELKIRYPGLYKAETTNRTPRPTGTACRATRARSGSLPPSAGASAAPATASASRRRACSKPASTTKAC